MSETCFTSWEVSCSTTKFAKQAINELSDVLSDSRVARTVYMGTPVTVLVGLKKVSLVTQNLMLFRNQKYVNELGAIKKSTRTTSLEMIFHKYTKNVVVTWSITKNDIHIFNAPGKVCICLS